MPSFTSLALLSLAAIGAIAAPAEKRWGHPGGQCISDSQADQVATAYAALIEKYTDSLADAVLTEGFTDYSESVNSLINSCPQGDAAKPLPLLDPTFVSRDQFKRGQGQQPPINFKQLNLWHSCDAVIIRWVTTNTANITDVKPVVGIITMEVVKNQNGGEYPWLIDTVYSEFDAAAWLQNLVEAGICSTNAGLPETGSNSTDCSAPVAPSSTVAPVSPSSTWAASSTWAPSSSWVASSSWVPEPSSTSCTEDESSTAWATQTAYAATSTWA